MSSNLDLINHFNNCKVEFPNNTSCSKVLNDIFIAGLCIYDFEEKYRNLTKSNLVLNTPSYKSSFQYNLKKDIWGPTEFIIVNKGGTDYEACLVYGIRDPSEYWIVDEYLSKLPNADLMIDKPGDRMYQIWPPYTNWERTKQIIISVLRHTEKSTMITVLLNF